MRGSLGFGTTSARFGQTVLILTLIMGSLLVSHADATDASYTTVLLKDISPGSAWSSPDAGGNPYPVIDTSAFFFAGNKLWRSDGTPSGTTVVKEVSGFGLTAADGSLFFSAPSVGTGFELWTSDGTPAGTAFVKDITPGLTSSSLYGFTAVDENVFFAASDGVHGVELWRTDG
jgi:ELWxxDGT repeat protein